MVLGFMLTHASGVNPLAISQAVRLKLDRRDATSRNPDFTPPREDSIARESRRVISNMS